METYLQGFLKKAKKVISAYPNKRKYPSLLNKESGKPTPTSEGKPNKEVKCL